MTRGRGASGATDWSSARLARRSALGHRRGQALALLAVAALITACTAFAPVYDRAMQQALVDTLLASASTDELAVTVESAAEVDARGATEALDPRDLRELVPPDVAAALGTPVLGRTASITPVFGDIPPTGPLVWREGACDHVRVLSGECPDQAGEILVSEPDVENFGLGPGSAVRVRTAVTGQTGVRLEVVGTYAPLDEAWWQGQTLVGMSRVFRGLEPSAAHDAWLTVEETFLGGPVFLGETTQSGALVRTASTDVDEVLALGERVEALSERVEEQDGELRVLSALDDLTGSLRAQTAQAHRTVPLLVAPLAVLSLFVLWLVLAAATEQRRGEVAVARLRGRGPGGAARLLLIELLPVLLVGVGVGAAAALAAGAVARALLPGVEPFETGPGFATAVLLATLAVVLATVAACVLVAREPLDSLVRGGRTASRRWALGALDTLLLAVVGTAVLAFVTGSLRGPLVLLGPALLALLAGLLLGHLAAPTASAVGRRLLRSGRLVAGVTLLETARRRETRVLMAVVTVACALAVFAVDALVVGERNRTNASQHDTGAPVVLRVDGLDLDEVRTAVDAVDPTGRRATPVMIARDTLAVEPDGFRRVAFFPRGAPSSEEWGALAPPAAEPVTLTGSRFSLSVRTAARTTAKDALGAETEVELSLVVTPESGTRRTIDLGTLPPPGVPATLLGEDDTCVRGCRLVGLTLTAPTGSVVEGGVELSDLRVDGQPVDWPTAPEDWNTTDQTDTFLRATTASTGALLLELRLLGSYPAEITPAWMPVTLAALLPEDRRDPLGLVVTGVDGSERAATSAGRVVLVPSMPPRSALVGLDALSRGAQFTDDAHIEVWLVDDEALVSDTIASLQDRGVAVEDVRRYATVRAAYDGTVAAWSLALGAVVAPVVILLALVVLLVLAVTGWRVRARDLAVLRLNGAGPRTTRSLAVWAQLPGALLAVATGVVAGVVGAALAIPDVPFLPDTPDTPVIDPAIAWPAVAVVGLACAVLLPMAAAAAGLATARRAHAERVKDGA